MAQNTPSQNLHSSLGKLQLSPSSKGTPTFPKNEPVDSWEDEADNDSSPDEGQRTPIHADTSPGPPPPTPSSPSMLSPHRLDSPYQSFPAYGLDAALEGRSIRRDVDSEERRPEKSTAVASRLIAAGIGQKAPRRTQEQREYDQAMKVQEKKRRDQAREEEERKKREREKAIRDAWDG
ncbi:hypothetical protein BDY17DRAFT_323234 [Neohortaea acidophila]|uniref:Uncharacterized protein n=1 Tax=Neohortaea acidophila TaxID=245834 RepID=A0A6A6PYT7_9PEZI|nr:uncharacterized protein BDY17DRAFT_323234 [Neohortaea acidophila]KAF2484377.1 hypothetical protein BDY17DRAFT_323234 [Neohortaea acidophila]